MQASVLVYFVFCLPTIKPPRMKGRNLPMYYSKQNILFKKLKIKRDDIFHHSF